MTKSLTKSEIIGALAESTALTKIQATAFLEALVNLAYKNAKNSFTLPGLGKLVAVNRKARIGRNPATGEQIKIAAKRVLKFRVAKAAKEAILGSEKSSSRAKTKTSRKLASIAALSDVEIQNIIFNETRSLSGPQIATARTNIAHAVINGEEHPPRPPSAPTTVGPIPPAEQAVYHACLTAVTDARAARQNGQDPTNAGKHFNFRKNNSTAPFQGHALRTQVGPLNNSFPTSDLPAIGIYGNTYA
jgi:DNA-binding protein HU-beta